MADEMSEFNFDDQWDNEEVLNTDFGEFLPTHSDPSAPSASTVSTVSSSDKEKEGHSTTDSTIWCRKCHRKPCKFIIKAAAAVTKTPMPIRWSDGAGAGAAVVVNRQATNPSPDGAAGAGAGAVAYNPTLKMEHLSHDFEQSGNVFGIESPLAPIFQGEDHSGLTHPPWIQKDTSEQDFPYVLSRSRDPDDPFGMGGGSKSSKKSYKKSSKKAKKSSRKAKRKSSRKSYRKSSRKAKRS